MFKGVITSATQVPKGTNIPFSVALNTNNNTEYNSTNSYVSILNAGYYDVSFSCSVTGVSGDISVQLFADGEGMLEAVASTTTEATTSLANLTIIDTVKVDHSVPNSFANVSVQFDQTVTVSNCVLLIERRK